MHVVTVVFRVNAGDEARFMAAMRTNASASMDLEPGCRQFDVCASNGGSEVFLYELYDDAAAFEQHMQMAHFQSFDTETRDWIAEKRMAVYDLVQGSAA